MRGVRSGTHSQESKGVELEESDKDLVKFKASLNLDISTDSLEDLFSELNRPTSQFQVSVVR